MPVIHMRGAHYPEIAKSTGGFFFVWTLWALGGLGGGDSPRGSFFRRPGPSPSLRRKSWSEVDIQFLSSSPKDYLHTSSATFAQRLNCPCMYEELFRGLVIALVCGLVDRAHPRISRRNNGLCETLYGHGSRF